MTLKREIKSLYRKFFYRTLKRVERIVRTALFGVIKVVYPKFNAFRSFGIPQGVESIVGEEVIKVEIGEPNAFPNTIETHSHERFYSLENHMPGGWLVLLKDGFSTAMGAHLTAEGRLIPEFTYQFTSPHIYAHKLFTFRKNRFRAHFPHFKESVASLVIDCQQNYFHFLYDALPKLHLIEKKGYQPGKYYVDTSKGFQREMLALLDIKQERIIPIDEYPIISADSLIVTSYAENKGHVFSKWALDFLKKSFLPHAKPSPYKRLFVSRRNAPCRKIINEEEFLPLLEKEGFTVIEPEQYSFVEQVSLFHGADIVMAPHGAALANLAFCKPRTKVVEIFSPRYPWVGYWIISNFQQLEYHYFRGEECEMTYSSEDIARDDILVNPDKVKKTLSRALNGTWEKNLQ